MSSERRTFFREIAAAAMGVKQAAEAATRIDDADLERHASALALADWSEEAQLRVREAAVLVVGAGGLGSPVALYLAGAGVGRLGIVDPNPVELSGLHRQLLHFTPDVGAPRAESAAAKLRFLNPDIVVEPYQARFGAAMVEGQDLVVDCTGADASRYAVNAACCAGSVPLVEGAATGFDGMVMTVVPGRTACYRCAFGDTAPASAEGILGPAAGVVGTTMALQALMLLGGLAVPEGVLRIDLRDGSSTRNPVARRPDCPDCGVG